MYRIRIRPARLLKFLCSWCENWIPEFPLNSPWIPPCLHSEMCEMWRMSLLQYSALQLPADDSRIPDQSCRLGHARDIPRWSVKGISKARSASQTKPCAQQGKVCCYGALDSELAPRLIAGTIEVKKTIIITGLRRNQGQITLEDTARYAGLLLAPAEGFGLWPTLFLPFGQKKSFLCCFGPFLAIFGVQ